MINITSSIPIIGIYKITSPSNKVYIGQSTNIQNRLKHYSKSYKIGTNINLYYSIKKYGWNAFKKEIIEECDITLLNVREAHYKQKFINEIGWSKAMFFEIWDMGTGGPRSEIIKQKISKGNLGKPKPKPKGFREKISKSLKGHTKNNTKNYLGTKNRNNKDKCFPILQYDKQGVFIKEWSSASEAELSLSNNKSNDNIRACCRGKQKTAYKYIWKQK
jgi:group I intron endonuclease